MGLAWSPGSGWSPSGRGVSIRPGTMLFTEILSGASSAAKAPVMPARPAFAAATCVQFGTPEWPEPPPILMMAPPPRLRMCGTQACTQYNVPSSVGPRVSRHSCGVMSINDAKLRTLALLTRMLGGPNALIVSSTSRLTSAGLQTSPWTAIARPPAHSIALTVSIAASFELR